MQCRPVQFVYYVRVQQSVAVLQVHGLYFLVGSIYFFYFFSQTHHQSSIRLSLDQGLGILATKTRNKYTTVCVSTTCHISYEVQLTSSKYLFMPPDFGYPPECGRYVIFHLLHRPCYFVLPFRRGTELLRFVVVGPKTRSTSDPWTYVRAPRPPNKLFGLAKFGRAPQPQHSFSNIIIVIPSSLAHLVFVSCTYHEQLWHNFIIHIHSPPRHTAVCGQHVVRGLLRVGFAHSSSLEKKLEEVGCRSPFSCAVSQPQGEFALASTSPLISFICHTHPHMCWAFVVYFHITCIIISFPHPKQTVKVRHKKSAKPCRKILKMNRNTTQSITLLDHRIIYLSMHPSGTTPLSHQSPLAPLDSITTCAL